EVLVEGEVRAAPADREAPGVVGERAPCVEHAYGAVRRPDEAGQDLQERRLAAAVSSGDGRQAARHLEAEPREEGRTGERLGDIDDLENGRHGISRQFRSFNLECPQPLRYDAMRFSNDPILDGARALPSDAENLMRFEGEIDVQSHSVQGPL